MPAEEHVVAAADTLAWAGTASRAERSLPSLTRHLRTGADSLGTPSLDGAVPMAKTKVAVFVGSLRKDSFNRKLAKAVEKLAPDDFEFTHVRIDNLPLYNQDFDADYPAEPARLKKDVEAADAVLFVTPEYNRAMPGVLRSEEHTSELQSLMRISYPTFSLKKKKHKFSY